MSIAIALSINSSTTTDPEWRSLADLPADQRVGQGLHTRRKKKPAEAAGAWLGAAIFLGAAPVATFLASVILVPLLMGI